MIRVLHIFNMMANGGIEHYVMDRYRKINRDKIQFDFLISSGIPGYFDDEILSMGGKVYYTSSLTVNPLRAFLQIKRIVKENGYQIVHRHTGNAIGYFELHAARAGGARYLIIHSHNNSATKLKLHSFAKKYLSLNCIRLACSASAGKWLFDDKSFAIMKNAIDTEKYRFNADVRQKYRNQFAIDSEALVIGHVGRLDYQKNHEFLIEIFNEVLKSYSNAILMCVGDGNLKPVLKEKADKLGITDNIIFTGNVDNVNDIINCFDFFCFPSRYEGFSITLTEAQVNGLKCFTSLNRVSYESNLSGNITYIPLTGNPKEWAATICTAEKQRDETAINKIVAAGYDLNQSVRDMEHFYEELLKNEHAIT